MVKTKKNVQKRERMRNYLKYAVACPPIKPEGQYYKQWQGCVGEFNAEEISVS